MADAAPRLVGRVAIVTGGSGGLGRGIAGRLAAEGCTVASLDIKEPAGPLEAGVQFLACDVTDREDVNATVRKVAEQFGGLDILVNNAGLLSGRHSFLDVTADQMHRYFDVNAVGPLLMTQAAYPYLKASEHRGRVINVASRTFFTGNAGQAAYVASKGALTGLTRVLANELGADGITVNAIVPAQVATPGTREHSGEEVFAATMSRQAIKEYVTPEHFAGLAAYLASPDAALITGQTLVYDGGGLLR
ncbi:SDR family oxidoreductase [Arthrobacter sp. CAU 1506]|uniref:SDR family NAD(P)-dependent oxidoreductase n=1 Tax=Arthrobacter sp. CAU 1506 TaxID=2560052 RepID=UPI0010ABC528|nr:SDR family oxidoreductase [Arthrobacter sp. CAU 1506]TJY69644.1 SDR family oxidoreductase [Arthrobacter sp. CAU 1506]